MDFLEYVFVHVIFLLKTLRLFPIASGLSLNSSEWLTQSSKTWALMSPAVPFSFCSPSCSLSVLEIVLPVKHDYFQPHSLCSPTFLSIFSFLLFAWLTLIGLLGLSWAITSFRQPSLTSQRWVRYSSVLPKDNTGLSTKPFLLYCNSAAHFPTLHIKFIFFKAQDYFLFTVVFIVLNIHSGTW